MPRARRWNGRRREKEFQCRRKRLRIRCTLICLSGSKELQDFLLSEDHLTDPLFPRRFRFLPLYRPGRALLLKRPFVYVVRKLDLSRFEAPESGVGENEDYKGRARLRWNVYYIYWCE
jgi:hypothetical protein